MRVTGRARRGVFGAEMVTTLLLFVEADSGSSFAPESGEEFAAAICGDLFEAGGFQADEIGKGGEHLRLLPFEEGEELRRRKKAVRGSLGGHRRRW